VGEKYHGVNSQWPDILPALTGQEAISAVRRLYRFAMKKPFRGTFKIATGNRYTWIRRHVFYVNPARTNATQPGWHDLVHLVSHLCHRRLHPGEDPHGRGHYWLEKDMVAYVVRSGWLDGKLRREEKPKPDPKVVKITSIEQRIKRWRTKAKRAQTALKKLERQKHRLAA
jgi:hypothetical protein